MKGVLYITLVNEVGLLFTESVCNGDFAGCLLIGFMQLTI